MSYASLTRCKCKRQIAFHVLTFDFPKGADSDRLPKAILSKNNWYHVHFFNEQLVIFWLYFDMEISKLQGQLRVGIDDLNRLDSTEGLKKTESQ